MWIHIKIHPSRKIAIPFYLVRILDEVCRLKSFKRYFFLPQNSHIFFAAEITRRKDIERIKSSPHCEVEIDTKDDSNGEDWLDMMCAWSGHLINPRSPIKKEHLIHCLMNCLWAYGYTPWKFLLGMVFMEWQLRGQVFANFYYWKYLHRWWFFRTSLFVKFYNLFFFRIWFRGRNWR